MRDLLLTRRRALTAAGLGALIGVTAGCSRGSGPAAESSAVRFAWWGNDVRAAVTEEAVQAFEASGAGVDVAVEFAGFDGYFDKLATQVAGGGGPDVFQMNEWNLRDYGDRGALLDLSEHGLRTDAWADGANRGGEIGGRAFGATAGVGLQAVVVDPQFFDDVGVELPDDTTWSWEEYHELGRELTSASDDGSYGLTFHAADQITAGFYVGQLGGTLFGDDGVTADPDVFAQWFQMWLAMVESGAAPSASAVIEDAGSEPGQSLLGQGRLAMQLAPANLLIQYESTLGRELQLMRIPTQTGRPADLGMWYRPSMLFCAAASTTDPDGATALIDFLLNDPAAAEILLVDRGVPPNEELRASIVGRLEDSDARVVAYMDACAADLVDAPSAPPAGAGSFPTLLGRISEDVLFGRVSPDDGGRSLVDELQAEVS